MNGHPHDPRGETQTEQEFLLQAPLLKNIEAQMKVCRNQKEWAILRAKQAIYLARTHRIAEAAVVPDELRKLFRGNEDAEVFVWIWLVEAVTDFYITASTRRNDLLIRANAVAKSSNLPALAQYSASWLANASLRDDDYKSMATWLRASALERAEYAEAVCRSAIVVAVSLQTIGDSNAAVKWFATARNTAQSIGDRATIMASIENSALMRLDRLWVDHVVGGGFNSEVASIENELLGALQYERITGSDAFLAQGEVAKIRLHMLRGNFVLALDGLRASPELMSDIRFSTASSLSAIYEWLQCCHCSGYAIDAALFDRLERQLINLDDDDAYVAAKYLLSILERFPDGPRSARIMRYAKDSYDRYINKLDDIRSSIDSLRIEYSL